VAAFQAFDPVFVCLRDAGELVNEPAGFRQQPGALFDFLVRPDLSVRDYFYRLGERFQTFVYGYLAVSPLGVAPPATIISPLRWGLSPWRRIWYAICPAKLGRRGC
jgi:hypothetical protein